MWHHKSTQQIYHSYCYTLTLPSETRWKKLTNSATFSCSLRYSELYSTSDFHYSPSANIISASLIAGMDGTNSNNSFRILRYSSLVVVYFPSEMIVYVRIFMMTSSNGNIFRVTGPLCGEFTGPGEFPTQRPVARSLDVRLNKRLSKQPWGWWFETPSWSLWRHCNGSRMYTQVIAACQWFAWLSSIFRI